MKSAISGLFAGFGVPFRGVELILGNKRVRRYAILPFLLVVITFLAGIAFALPALVGFVPMFANSALGLLGLASGGIASGALYVTLLLVTWPMAIFALLFALFLVSKLIAAPFYALLAERVLVETGLRRDTPFRLSEWIALSGRLFVIALIKIAIFTIVGLALFILSFIPGVGLFTAFGFLLMASFDIVDISLEALNMGLMERFRFFRDEFPAFVGLACMLGLVFLIPGLNFFLFPAAVAGSSGILRRRLARVQSIKG